MENYSSILLEFLNRLNQSNIHFTLSQEREESIMIHICVPGERWEVEFMQDGSIETEIFCSDGKIHDENSLKDLFGKFSD